MKGTIAMSSERRLSSWSPTQDLVFLKNETFTIFILDFSTTYESQPTILHQLFLVNLCFVALHHLKDSLALTIIA